MFTALPLRVVVPELCITNPPPLPLIKLLAEPNLKLGAPRRILLPDTSNPVLSKTIVLTFLGLLK